MLTLFSTPKPFEGHVGVIQRNALKSWTLLHPDVEIILFGDEPGAADICREFGLRHQPVVERTEDGPPSVRFLFSRAQQISRHSILCYSNCDIVLGRDFLRAIERVSDWTKRYLIVGRRWDTDVTAPLDFTCAEWGTKLRELVFREGIKRLYYNIDYFVFPRGLYTSIPPLAVGRRYWDNWAVWNASAEKALVVDASEVVVAVHQNHDYSSHPQGWQGVWYGNGSKRNFELAGGYRHLHTIEDATHRLTEQGIEPRRLYFLAPAKRFIRRRVKWVRDNVRVRIWHPVLGATRAVRHALGLRHENFKFSWRRQVRRHECDR